MVPPFSSPHLLSCVIFLLLTTLTSATLRFIGETQVFRCHSDTVTASPLFQHKPNGGTSPVTLFTGVYPRPGTDARHWSEYPWRITAEKIINATSGVHNIYVYTIKNIQGKDGGEYNCDFGQPWAPMLLTPIARALLCPESLEVVEVGEDMKANCTLQKNGPDLIEIKWRWQGDVLLKHTSTAELNLAISTLDELAIPAYNNTKLECFMDFEGVKPCSVIGNVHYPPFLECPHGTFACTNSCIPMNWQCDGYSDCKYGEDEWDCYGTTTYPTTDYPGTATYPTTAYPTTAYPPTPTSAESSSTCENGKFLNSLIKTALLLIKTSSLSDFRDYLRDMLQNVRAKIISANPLFTLISKEKRSEIAVGKIIGDLQKMHVSTMFDQLAGEIETEYNRVKSHPATEKAKLLSALRRAEKIAEDIILTECSGDHELQLQN